MPIHTKLYPKYDNPLYRVGVGKYKYGYQLQRSVGPKEERRVETKWLRLDVAFRILKMMTCPHCGHKLTGKKREALLQSVLEGLI
jgi:hypothetical protein